MDPETFGALVRRYESGGNYNSGYGGIDLSNSPLDQNGFPIWAGKMGSDGISHAAGAYQFEPGTWAPYAQQLGITDFSPASQDRVFQAAYADQGTRPWMPYNSKLRTAYNAALAGNSMIPSFGTSRFAADLMPSDPTGASLIGSQLAFGGMDPTAMMNGSGGGTASTTLDPVNNTAPAPSADPTGGFMDLLKNGGGMNPQKLLASMAAGFLGGRGPAQSLAGGFAGAAKSTQEDQGDLMKLAQLSAMYGPLYQERMEKMKADIGNAQAMQKQKALTNAAAMARTGAMGMGTALKLNGIDPSEYGSTEQQLNDQTFSDKPLPAGTQKMVDNHTAAIATIRSNRATLDGIQQQIQNGTFKPDALHMNVLYPAQAALGNPMGDPGVVAYQQWKAASSSLANDILNSAKGVQTDSDRKAAMDVLSGGGLTSVDQANAHINFLQNRGALVEQEHHFAVDQEYKNAKKGQFNWDAFENTLPAAPSGTSAKDIGTGMYAPHNVGQPSASAPGLAASDQALIQKYLQPQQ